ncbi:uncharacterized protein LOC129276341 [Lytechinus pictus]|uniref:uncharacterized protein LOC129276341 n=1 Tax=Lytechinus pictus TaxID=7653 RepID=UPI0030B9DD91
MALLKRTFTLLIILWVQNTCQGEDTSTTRFGVFNTTPITEYETKTGQSQLEDHGTHSALQLTTTFPENDDIDPDVDFQKESPGQVSKRHKCGFIDSCFGRCGSGPSDFDSIYTYLVSTKKISSIRTGYLCFCDSRCPLYGDCCSDYDVQCLCDDNELNGKLTDGMKETDVPSGAVGVVGASPHLSMEYSLKDLNDQDDDQSDDMYLTKHILECTHLDEVEFGSVLVETKCHADWKDKNIETHCTNIDHRDDIAKLFVQGTDGITYRNIFCAKCNFVSIFHFWIQDAYCHGELPNSVYDKPEILSSYLRKYCITRFRVPFGQEFRPCLRMIDHCPTNISQKSRWLEQNCVSGHLSLVATDISSSKVWGSTLYRNAFCAECNGVEESLIKCPTKDTLQDHFLRNSTGRDGPKQSNGDREITNRIVTNYNMAAIDQSSTVVYEENGLVVRIIDTCEEGQVFDPYLGKCRQLYCADGYTLVKQDCVPVTATDELDDDDIVIIVEAITAAINESIGLNEELVITVQLSLQLDNNHKKNKDGAVDVQVPSIDKGELPFNQAIFNNSSWDIYISPVYANGSVTDQQPDDVAYEVIVTMVVANPEDVTKNNAKLLAEILGKLSELNNANEMIVYVNDVCVKTPPDGSFAFIEILNGNLTDLNYLINYCKHGNLTIVQSSEFTIHGQETSCPIVFVNSTSRLYDCYENYIFGYDSTISTDEQTFGALVCDMQSRINPKCERILLNETEYEILPNGSMVSGSGIVYDPPDYYYTPQGVLVCTEYTNVISETVVVFFDFSRAQTILAYTGLAISSLCLLITLLTYVMFSELRTLPGLNIMALIVSSIGGNITFIINLNLVPGSLECQVTAVIMHYFFLTRIFWTNAIVFHAFQTFGPKMCGCANRSLDVLHKSRDKSRLRQHIPYALYAWCVPSAFTAVGSACHFGACGPLPVYYGTYFSCWIADPYSFLYLFVLPLAILLTINVIMFSPIVYNLHKARSRNRHSLKKESVVQEPTKKPAEIAIYAKLSTTTGFSWMFGILASFTDQDFFWHLFIIFMSLEGLFIFLSFFCTKRIKNMYVKRFGKKCNEIDLARKRCGPTRSAYAISQQVERRNSNESKETFTTLNV